MDDFEMEEIGRRRHTWWYVLVILFTLVLAYSAASFARILWNARKESQDFARLAQIAAEDKAAAAQEPAAAGESDTGTVPERSGRYDALYQMNPDFVGWLSIDQTKVDYPVMHTPQQPQYYIYRDFEGKKTASGTPFMDAACTVDSDSIILYGHNMKNGSMFGTLDEYLNRKYWEEHPVITFNTLKEDREYEIFAVLRTRLLYENERGFAYYKYVGDLTEEQFDEFVSQVCAGAEYDTGIVPEYGDQILMLSTCSYHTENGRLVVVGRR